MRVIEYHRPPVRNKPKSSRLLRNLGILVIVVVFLSSTFIGWRYIRPLPPLEANVPDLLVASHAAQLTWPRYGQSAVGAVGYGVLDEHGPAQPQPIASITKVVTVLTILQKKPLKDGQSGPTITITKADQAIFDAYETVGGSVVPIKQGEQLTEYQAIQAMLLPSANNIADTLAIWAFGSLGAYERAANAYVASLGMSQTKVTDASGLSATTVSTAHDLIKLGIAAMEDPIVSQVVDQTQVDFPVAGIIYNVNGMLGKNGIVGIKPGNTDEAGGCFLGAAKVTLANGEQRTVVSAILNGPNLVLAMVDSRKLLASMPSGFGSITVVKAGTKLGFYNVPWGQPVAVTATKTLTVTGWLGQRLKPIINLQTLQGGRSAGVEVGSLKVASGPSTSAVGVALAAAIPSPSATWRRQQLFYL